MKPGFVPNPIINPRDLSKLVTHIQKSDPKLFDALIKGNLDIVRAYGILKDHEDRLITLEKQKKYCSLSNSADFPVPTGAGDTLVTFNTEDYDNDDMHNMAANTDRITFNTPGWYDVGANVVFETDGFSPAVGYRQLRISVTSFLTGVVTPIAFIRQVPVTGSNSGYNLSRSWYFMQGDYIQLLAVQTSGIAIDLLFVAGAKIGCVFWAAMDERIWNPEDIPYRQMG